MALKKKEKDGWIKYDMSDPKQKAEVEKKMKEDIERKYGKKKKKPEKVSPKMKEEIASDLINKLPPPEEKNKPPEGPGRPPKITSSVMQKLKVCFSVGMTNKQASYFCGIAERTLQYYLEENPEFLQEIEILKTSISLQAKFNIGRAIKTEEAKNYGGTSNSWKRLEKKDPEFKSSNTADIDINDGEKKISIKVKLPE